MSEKEIVPTEMEMENLRAFGELYFSKAVDIMYNPDKVLEPTDVEIMHKSLGFLISMYLNRVRSGEFDTHTLH